MSIKVAVIGAGGRMGQEIFQVIHQTKGVEAFLAFSRKPVDGFHHSVNSLTDPLFAKADIIIDFSGIELFDKVLLTATKFKKPLVSGVTGLSAAQQKKLQTASKTCPILWASNMSLGVAVLKEALSVFSALHGFDFQIEELHHNRKKDNPSGTAITLQNELAAVTKTQPPKPIGIRGGGIFGVHKVWAMSDEEVLCFEHQALNRTVFARGAVRAAQWLVKKKKSGLYSMKEVLFSK